MRQRLRDVFRGPVVFYPLLFAAFPVLFLYAYNIHETSAGQVWLPLAMSVGGAIVLWAVLSLILRSLAKAALATAIFLALFFSYGRLQDGLHYLGVSVPKHAHLLPSVLFIWVYCVYFISRAKRDFRITTRLLNVVAVALIAINLFNIGSYEIRLRGVEAVRPANTWEQAASGDQADLSTLPDIYLIITDEYAHPETMLEYYDYDISWFIDSLEKKGFFMAQGSRAYISCTTFLIASVLNMEYVAFTESVETVYTKIVNNSVADFLRGQGYKYVFFGSPWDMYSFKVDADIYYNSYGDTDSRLVSEFARVLWNSTMLRPFHDILIARQFETLYRRGVLRTLEHLKDMPGVDGPKFVFVHLYSPHEPFVFGPEGEYVEPANWHNWIDPSFYLGQYAFISKQMEGVVDTILEESDVPPIIIIQSDHGIRPHDWGYHPILEHGRDEWRKILNAVYLPGMDYGEISQAISPVNTFRLIFNHYFGADYELLPDDWEQ